MRQSRRFKWLPTAVAAVWPAIGMAVEPTGQNVDGQQETLRQLRQTRGELNQLRDEVRQLRGEASGNWLNQQRVEEVKALVQEVLADADTRASLLEGGTVAGHNGKSFFLSNDDGSFLLKLAGQIQLRYIGNFRNDDPDTAGAIDEGEGGFVIRRAKVAFSGHVAEPRLKYAIQLAVDRSDNTAVSDKIVVSYELLDGLTIWVGEDKAPFLREELTSSKYQLAVERSYAGEVFTIDKAQGVALLWEPHEMVRLHTMLNDGLKSGDAGTSVNPFTQKDDFDAQANDRGTTKDFNDDASDYAVSSRVDIKLMGDWNQMKDFTSWPDEELAVFLGSAVHYEEGESGDSFANNNFVSWTVDGSVEYRGFNFFAAGMGMHTDIDGAAKLLLGAKEYDIYGVVLQGGYNIPIGATSVEPFARYEHLDFDTAITDTSGAEDEVDLLTFGVNWYLTQHAAKFTADVVWALDPLPIKQAGLGLLADDGDEDDQVALRLQFQLLF